MGLSKDGRPIITIRSLLDQLQSLVRDERTARLADADENETEVHYVQVLRREEGPFDGAIIGDVLAYTFVWQDAKQQPPFTHHERVFVLLDVGAQLANPPLWQGGRERDSWYIDLVTVEIEGDLVRIRDLSIDVIVATDGRGYRMLDLEEYGEALKASNMSLEEAIDGLKRWQLFLDRYLHDGPFPVDEWPDFPPAGLQSFEALDTLSRGVAPER